MTFEVTKNNHPGGEKESCSVCQASAASCRSATAIVASSSLSPCITAMHMLGTRTQGHLGHERSPDLYIETSVALLLLTHPSEGKAVGAVAAAVFCSLSM
mmetsp:Transcript_40324/g.64637  ORF Transcript_40324/g.64637 Transcript_40324/m.64637 type:complete len:100 (-) Transcript_40324:100-399(-)